MKNLFANKILLLVVGVIVAFGLWYGLSSPSSDTTSLLDTTTDSAATDPASQEVLETLLALRAISLDGTVFQNPAFQSLQDFSTEIMPEPVGRPNPFAPLGVGGSSSQLAIPDGPAGAGTTTPVKQGQTAPKSASPTPPAQPPARP